MSLLQLLGVLAIYFLLIRPLIRKLASGLSGPRDPKDAARVLRAIYIVAAKVAHADGEETQHELDMVVRMVRMVMGNNNISAESIIEQYRMHSHQNLTREEVQSLSMQFRHIVFSCAFNVAISDNKVSEAELKTLRQIGGTLEIPSHVIDEFLSRLGAAASAGSRTFQGRTTSAVDFAYKVLELEKGATPKQIKRRYRELAIKSHPDRFPDGEKAAATERFKEIGDAYRILQSKI